MTSTIVSNARSDVYYKETNLSQIIRNVNNSTGAQVQAARKGPLERKFITDTEQYIATYGKPDPTISFGHYTALQFLKFAPLWIRRVVNTDARYGGLFLESTTDGGGITIDSSLYNDDAATNPIEFSDPANEIALGDATFDATYQHGVSGELLFFAVPYLGPGEHSKNLALRIQSKNMKDPAAPTLTAVTVANGTLAADTYYYVITAINDAGETIASSDTSLVLAGPNNAINISWAEVDGASGYRVYGRDSNTNFYYIATTSTNAYQDTGAVTPDTDVIPPTSSFRTSQFKILIFDNDQSLVNPVEAFDVSLKNEQDGLGRNLEIAQKINTYSNYVRIYKNETLNLSDNAQYPYVYNTAKTYFSTGIDGSLPTNSQIATGWDDFAERDLVTVRILINAGYSTVVVQQKMNSIADQRKDCVAVLDTPTDKQRAIDALDYRRNILNMNSSRSAIYTPDVRINDPYSDQILFVPPSGFAAGTYAFTDTVANAWISPAGLNRGLLDESLGLRYEYSEPERDMLAGAQVNYIRRVAGAGNAIWEQLTLASQLSALSYVHVRRLLDVIFVTETEAAKFYLQEPNDDFLARQLVSVIGQFLDGIKNQRGLTDYAVVSDASNNDAAVLNNGQRTVQVFLIPTLAAGKILLESIIGPQGVTAQELVATVNA